MTRGQLPQMVTYTYGHLVTLGWMLAYSRDPLGLRELSDLLDLLVLQAPQEPLVLQELQELTVRLLEMVQEPLYPLSV